MSKIRNLDVVIETPAGCRNKLSYDERLRAFRLSKVLPAGYSFPYDFGFVPGTKAPDGDPLDILVLLDEPTFPGCIVEVRLLGLYEAKQTEKGKTVRNDRLIGVATEARDYQELQTLKDIEPNLQAELEHFFVTYHQTRGVTFRILRARGPASAAKMIQAAKTEKKARKRQSIAT